MQTEKVTTRISVIGFTLLITMLPMAMYGCGPEWARWDAAQAVHYFNNGDVDNAIQQLRDAIRKSPRDPVLKLTLASRLLEIEQPQEALELSDQVISVYPDAESAFEIKSLALQNIGDFEGALESWLEFDQQLDARQRNAGKLNQLAYFRSLANKGLYLAKRDIDVAIEAMNRSLRWKGDEGLTLPIKAIVVATMVARCCDAHQQAINILTPEILKVQSQIDDARKRVTENTYVESSQPDAAFDSNLNLSLRDSLRTFENRAAALISCRAIVYQDLGDRIRSQADRASVKQLGHDCSQIIKNLPEDQAAAMYLSQMSAFLDTRGFICSLLPWSKTARGSDSNFVSSFNASLRDIDAAIFCSSIDLKSFDFPVRNSMEFFGNRTSAKKAGKKNLAVMLNHRSQILQRAGKHQRADLDLAKIRELGEEPGPALF